MLERTFQSKLISELKAIFPGCVVLKNDANYIQGFPDLLILFEDRWAALEVKQSESAHLQPNQEYYLSMLDRMSFASIVYPENKDDVIISLKGHFDWWEGSVL